MTTHANPTPTPTPSPNPSQVSSHFYALFLPLLLLPPVRWLLTKCVPPGLGPSPAMQAAGRWRCEVAADGEGGNGGSMRVRGSVVGIGQDPGYKSTSMMEP